GEERVLAGEQPEAPGLEGDDDPPVLGGEGGVPDGAALGVARWRGSRVWWCRAEDRAGGERDEREQRGRARAGGGRPVMHGTLLRTGKLVLPRDGWCRERASGGVLARPPGPPPGASGAGRLLSRPARCPPSRGCARWPRRSCCWASRRRRSARW